MYGTATVQFRDCEKPDRHAVSCLYHTSSSSPDSSPACPSPPTLSVHSSNLSMHAVGTNSNRALGFHPSVPSASHTPNTRIIFIRLEREVVTMWYLEALLHYQYYKTSKYCCSSQYHLNSYGKRARYTLWSEL